MRQCSDLGVFTNLPNCRNACQWQKKAKVVMKVGVATGNRLAIDKVSSLKAFAIGSKDKLGLLLSRRWAILQGDERGADFPFGANLYVDIIALEDTADVRFIRATAIASELFNRSWLIAKGFKEGKRESRWVKGRFG